MGSTRISRRIAAPREKVYAALIDADAVARWRVPPGMSSHVHAFDARPGGEFRVSLSYESIAGVGKTSERTDTYHGHFVKLVPNEMVVEALEFESDDPALHGEMTITITLLDADGGTELRALHEGVPDAVPPADNELGWQQALDKLALLVEAE